MCANNNTYYRFRRGWRRGLRSALGTSPPGQKWAASLVVSRVRAAGIEEDEKDMRKRVTRGRPDAKVRKLMAASSTAQPPGVVKTLTDDKKRKRPVKKRRGKFAESEAESEAQAEAEAEARTRTRKELMHEKRMRQAMCHWLLRNITRLLLPLPPQPGYKPRLVMLQPLLLLQRLMRQQLQLVLQLLPKLQQMTAISAVTLNSGPSSSHTS
eukprot:jgi/Tetstr1/421767/TSEL_012671.t1